MFHSLKPARSFVGSEIKKTRPCLVISPDEMNHNIKVVIVAPMTTSTRPYASRVSCVFRGTSGQIVLDQIRAVDRSRLVGHLGILDKRSQKKVLKALAEFFAP
jgi:mRNA interferase MazF